MVSRAGRRKVGILDTKAQLFGGFDFETKRQTRDWSIVPELRGRFPPPGSDDMDDPEAARFRLLDAVARGEIPPDVDLDLAADLIVGPIAVRLFFTGGKISPRIVGPLIELALEGIRRG